MEVVRLETLAPLDWPEVALTIGNFDGVHRGHQPLVRETVAVARASAAGTAVVLTFDPLPEAVVGPGPAPPRLMTQRQKQAALAELGVDRMAVLPFTPELAVKSPQDFARDVLGGALRARTVVVGDAFRFGRGRAGDVRALVRLGGQLGFEVRILPPTLHDGRRVSSTRIREALAEGAVAEARALLGRPFAVEGEVVRGVGRGRALGVPTANLRPENEALPAGGVYACWCRLEGGDGRWPAAVNIGRRPTFGTGDSTVEAHLLDFTGEVYGRRLELSFESRLRAERAFPDGAALVAQIRADLETARRILGSA